MITSIVIAVCAMLPPTISAVAALIVSLRTDKKAADIKHMVNSQRDEMVADLKAAKGEIAELKRLVTTLSSIIQPVPVPILGERPPPA